MKLLFIGFGNVAKEMARIFTNRHLYPGLDYSPSIVGVFTGRHGGIENKDGINITGVLKTSARTGLSQRTAKGFLCLHLLKPYRSLTMMCLWNFQLFP